MRDRARAKGVNSYEAGKGHREVERKRPGGQLNVTHEDKIQREISLSVIHAPVHTHTRTHTHTHTLWLTCRPQGGRPAVADHTVLFIMSFSTQAFDSGRAEVGARPVPECKALASLGQTPHWPHLEGSVCWLRALLGHFPTVSGSSPESTCRGPWYLATGRADTGAWKRTSPRHSPEAYRPRGRMAFPAGGQLSAALCYGWRNQGAFWHQEPGFLLVEAPSLHSQC